MTAGKAPVMEIAVVDDRLIDAFSTRGAGIKPVMDRLVDEYTQTHGRAPDNVAARKLSERAWQETRPAKQHRTVSALKADAWQRARLLGFSERTPDTVPWAPRQATRVTCAVRGNGAGGRVRGGRRGDAQGGDCPLHLG